MLTYYMLCLDYEWSIARICGWVIRGRLVLVWILYVIATWSPYFMNMQFVHIEILYSFLFGRFLFAFIFLVIQRWGLDHLYFWNFNSSTLNYEYRKFHASIHFQYAFLLYNFSYIFIHISVYLQVGVSKYRTACINGSSCVSCIYG